MTDREPAGTTTLDNGAIRYDCCGNTGGTPRIQHTHEDGTAYEEYACPYCGAYQGEREVNPDTLDDPYDEQDARAFREVGT